MSLFGSIMHKIFHHDDAQPAAATPDAAQPDTVQPEAAKSADVLSVNSSAAAAASTTAPSAPVDVEAVLTQMASQKGGGGNWQTSIVDLLKMLDLDSSLNARKDLGNELNVHVGADGTAEQNIALHHAVMQKLAENGGKVPDSLKG